MVIDEVSDLPLRIVVVQILIYLLGSVFSPLAENGFLSVKLLIKAILRSIDVDYNEKLSESLTAQENL